MQAAWRPQLLGPEPCLLGCTSSGSWGQEESKGLAMVPNAQCAGGFLKLILCASLDPCALGHLAQVLKCVIPRLLGAQRAWGALKTLCLVSTRCSFCCGGDTKKGAEGSPACCPAGTLSPGWAVSSSVVPSGLAPAGPCSSCAVPSFLLAWPLGLLWAV